MNNDKIPCCEISSEQSVEKECIALCPFYTIYYPFHCLAARLRRFMPVQCERSEAHEREKRERNPCREPTKFYASDNTPLRSSRRSRDAGFPIIYPNLSVRLKKVHGFYTVFSLFRTENCGIFCVFPTVFLPPRQERTR
jgi:hypothetical protein